MTAFIDSHRRKKQSHAIAFAKNVNKPTTHAQVPTQKAKKKLADNGRRRKQRRDEQKRRRVKKKYPVTLAPNSNGIEITASCSGTISKLQIHPKLQCNQAKSLTYSVRF
jgi:hypothetical protein